MTYYLRVRIQVKGLEPEANQKLLMQELIMMMRNTINIWHTLHNMAVSQINHACMVYMMLVVMAAVVLVAAAAVGQVVMNIYLSRSFNDVVFL